MLERTDFHVPLKKHKTDSYSNQFLCAISELASWFHDFKLHFQILYLHIQSDKWNMGCPNTQEQKF